MKPPVRSVDLGEPPGPFFLRHRWWRLTLETRESQGLVERIRIVDVLNDPVPRKGNDELLDMIERQMNRGGKLPRNRLNLDRLTTFQQTVLDGVCLIPPGETISYGGLASQIGRPGAARAVGQALAANPFPLVIPCHRVIRSNGRMGGYGGEPGSGLKTLLLKYERNPNPRYR